VQGADLHAGADGVLADFLRAGRSGPAAGRETPSSAALGPFVFEARLQKRMTNLGRFATQASYLGLALVILCSGYAAAQGPISRNNASLPPAVYTQSAGGSVEPDSTAGALQAELAWLGDPSTFACQLEAREDGGKLMIRGSVPDEAVRGHVLELACQASGMQVVDRLQIDATRTIRQAKLGSFSLRRAALTAIIHALPQHVYDITIDTWGDGQIVLRGSVDTYEEKLLASRCLRQVPGCNCVLNQLSVRSPQVSPMPPVQPGGHGTNNDAITPARLDVEPVSAPSSIEQAIVTKQPVANSGDIGNPSAEPEPRNWAAVTFRAVRGQVTGVFRWRPSWPRLFGRGSDHDQSYTEPILPVPKAIPSATQPSSDPSFPVDARLTDAPSEYQWQAAAHGTEQVISAAPACALPDGTATPVSALFEERVLCGPGFIYPARMARFIGAVCGKSPSDISCALVSQDELEIQVHAATSQEATAISNHLLQLPELKAYRLCLKINTNP